MIQEPTLSPGTQLFVAVTTSSSGSFFTQLLQVKFSFYMLSIIKLYVILKKIVLQDFHKNYGDGLPKNFDKNYDMGYRVACFLLLFCIFLIKDVLDKSTMGYYCFDECIHCGHFVLFLLSQFC